MNSTRIGLLAILTSGLVLAGNCVAQNNSGTAPTVPGSKLSPDKQAMLNRMPGRYRSILRRNLQVQQTQEDIARAAAQQKAEADRKEALRKAELRRSAADASRNLKERERDRAERMRKQGDDTPAHRSSDARKSEPKTSGTRKTPPPSSATGSAEKKPPTDSPSTTAPAATGKAAE